MYVSVCVQSDVCSGCVCGYMRAVCMWTVYMWSLFRACDLHAVCDKVAASVCSVHGSCMCVYVVVYECVHSGMVMR